MTIILLLLFQFMLMSHLLVPVLFLLLFNLLFILLLLNQVILAKYFTNYGNISAEKIGSTSFNLLEKSPSKIKHTRSATESLGMKRKVDDVHPAIAYKM